MFDKEKFGKRLVPMVTPFKEDQSVDHEAAVSIAEKLIKDNQADSLVLSGTTGEFFTMNFEERVNFLPLFRSWGQNGRTNPCSLLKESMKMVGYNAGIPRLPLTPGTEEEIAEVRRVMKKLNII